MDTIIDDDRFNSEERMQLNNSSHTLNQLNNESSRSLFKLNERNLNRQYNITFKESLPLEARGGSPVNSKDSSLSPSRPQFRFNSSDFLTATSEQVNQMF